MLQNLETFLLIIALAFGTTFLAVPQIIRLAKKRKLVDQPNERKMHKEPIPTLGGIGIMLGVLTALTVVLLHFYNPAFIWVVLAVFLMAGTGVADDLLDLPPKPKLLLQLLAACFLCLGGIKFTHLGGFLGIETLPMMLQYGLTIFFVVGFMNAFNFIDGIDGLAGGIGLMGAAVFAVFFAQAGDWAFCGLAAALTGALLGFLYYNFNPAKIFMGDTGSLSIGLLLAAMGIRLMNLEAGHLFLSNSLVLFTGILLLPLYDMTRISIQRIMNGSSPFKADKTHIHHLLIQVGYNHKKAALWLYFANAILIAVAFFIKDRWGLEQSIIVLILLGAFLTEFITIKRWLLARFQIKEIGTKAEKLEQENQFLLRNTNVGKK